MKRRKKTINDKVINKASEDYWLGYAAGVCTSAKGLDDKIQQIVMNYTFEQQRSVFAEECAEAIQAAMKVSRSENSAEAIRQALDNLTSEVADVIIMAQQMRFFLGENKVDKEIEFKLNRQLERIKEESR